jgi:TolB protein
MFLAMMKRLSLLLALFVLVLSSLPSAAQDWIKTGTGLGVEKIRIAVPDFKSAPDAAQLNKSFNAVLWNDLEQAGIFDMVSKSFYPLGQFGAPGDIQPAGWNTPPPNASMIAFGNLAVANNTVGVQGWLYDVRNPQGTQVLAKQYRETATEENARVIAHRFANEIIFRLGGGINGITDTHIYYVRQASGTKEIWKMDYDGFGQQAVTHLGSISLSPRLSPDGGRIAFASMSSGGWNIQMFSTDLGRAVSFPRSGGTNLSPAWSSDGTHLAYSSSRNGFPNIYVSDQNGNGSKQITSGKGPDVSPVWNPKTNAQIAFVSGRSGLPQIYVMDADGSNVQRITNEGYAVSPSWSPNGQFLAFAWIRHYGPGAPGAQDIYIMDVASKQWVQLTHDTGRNDFPSWSPDGRHLVYQSNKLGSDQIWTMLADGSQQHQLTTSGVNSQPNWGAK